MSGARVIKRSKGVRRLRTKTPSMSVWKRYVTSLVSLMTVMQAVDCSKWSVHKDWNFAVQFRSGHACHTEPTEFQLLHDGCQLADAINLKWLWRVVGVSWSNTVHGHTSKPASPSWSKPVDYRQLNQCRCSDRNLGHDHIGVPQTDTNRAVMLCTDWNFRR